jgi:hypothetical protein
VFHSNELQVIEDFDYSDFCALLEAGMADTVTNLNGLTILSFNRAAVICHGDRCTMISAPGVSLGYQVRRAHDLLEPTALAS